MFKVGDKVEFYKKYQDNNNDEFTWVVVGDEEKGRVDVSPVLLNGEPVTIKSIHTVNASWLKHAK